MEKLTQKEIINKLCVPKGNHVVLFTWNEVIKCMDYYANQEKESMQNETIKDDIGKLLARAYLIIEDKVPESEKKFAVVTQNGTMFSASQILEEIKNKLTDIGLLTEE